MNFKSGYNVELWFYLMMQKMRLLDNTPLSLATVIKVAKRHLPGRYKRALEFIENPESVEEFIDRAFKIDCLLQVENIEGIVLRVAVDVSANATLADSKFQEIQLPGFARMREELGIDRHWVILVNQGDLPTQTIMIDAIYGAIDEPHKCAMINLSQD